MASFKMLILLAAILMSQIVLSSRTKHKRKKGKSKRSINQKMKKYNKLTQEEMKKYIDSKIINHDSEQLLCRLDEYVDEGTCRPCEEICGVEITQYCQFKCAGYLQEITQREINESIKLINENKIVNVKLEDKVFVIGIILAGFILLVIVFIFLMCLFMKRTEKKRGAISCPWFRKPHFPVQETTTASSRSESMMIITEVSSLLQQQEGNVGEQLVEGNTTSLPDDDANRTFQ